MSDTEYRLKYPIGSKIRYAPNVEDVNSEARKDIGKQGTVIGYSGGKVRILLPTSENWGKTWRTRWEHIVPVIEKNQQLLFAFMSD